MRMTSLAIAGAVLLASVASASATTVTGRITRIDAKSDAITLEDGKVFTLPEGVEAESLKVGEKVEINYTGKTPHLRASSVRPVK
ncbi:DUF1344 domain-containing protein [Labrys okinawensis]|uniref:DUF1344 domain-containing protein n=1 Tax=Labrys okinawensis TaxID=346911 RepID=UPI0039BC549F